MKKQFITIVVCGGLLLNSMAAALSPKRVWECRSEEAAKKNGCSEKERKEARGWIIGSSVAAVVALFVAIGIVRGPKAWHEGKIQAIDTKIEALRYERNHGAPGDYSTRKKIDADLAVLHAQRAELAH